MNVMTLPDEEARALGVDTGRMRLVIIAAATLMTAAVVSISGVIGWIGLLVPHAARLLVGPDFGRLLPASMLLGGGYLRGGHAGTDDPVHRDPARRADRLRGRAGIHLAPRRPRRRVWR